MKRLGDPAIVVVMGNEEWAPTEDDLVQMRNLLAETTLFKHYKLDVLVVSRAAVKLEPTDELVAAFPELQK